MQFKSFIPKAPIKTSRKAMYKMGFLSKVQAWKIRLGAHEVIILNRLKGISVIIDGKVQEIETRDNLLAGNTMINLDGNDIYISVVGQAIGIEVYAVTGEMIPFTYHDEKRAYIAEQNFLGHSIRIEETTLSKRRIFLDNEVINTTGPIVVNTMNPFIFTLEEKNIYLMPTMREAKGAIRHIDFIGVIGHRLNTINGTYDTKENTFSTD